MKPASYAPGYDPNQTAQQQAGLNRDTAVTQAELNMINQRTPQGSLTYNPIGKSEAGNPRYEAVTSYSPEQQEIYNLGTQTERNLAGIGVSQSSKIADLLNQPLKLDNEATESRLYELGTKRIDPRFAQEEDRLRTRLVNSGVRPGTEAWDRQMGQLGETKNDAYNQLLLQGRAQAIAELLQQRNQPINEITALMSGSQVSDPNFTKTPTTGVAPTDLLGAQQAYLAQANKGIDATNAYKRAMMDGMFKIGSSVAGGWAMSDRRVKTDIKKVGKLDSGLPVYSFRYKEGGGLMQLGLMAQDVKKRIPEAVATVDDAGHMAVDYSRVAEAAHGG